LKLLQAFFLRTRLKAEALRLGFDCFWFNMPPNWGSYDPTINDDPGDRP